MRVATAQEFTLEIDLWLPLRESILRVPRRGELLFPKWFCCTFGYYWPGCYEVSWEICFLRAMASAAIMAMFSRIY